MENGSAAIASYYAGDFMTMYEENEDLEFYYPSEGTNLYVDAMCIPTSAKNKCRQPPFRFSRSSRVLC